MFMLTDRLRPNTKEVASKVIDGEAILINLSNGIYYSLDGVGAFIWERVEHGHSLEDLVDAVSERFDVTVEQAQAGVQELTTELGKESLVTASDDGPSEFDTSYDMQQTGLPYEAPTLNIYRDMGDLLALDPPMPGLADMAWKDTDDEATT